MGERSARRAAVSDGEDASIITATVSQRIRHTERDLARSTDMQRTRDPAHQTLTDDVRKLRVRRPLGGSTLRHARVPMITAPAITAVFTSVPMTSKMPISADNAPKRRYGAHAYASGVTRPQCTNTRNTKPRNSARTNVPNKPPR